MIAAGEDYLKEGSPDDSLGADDITDVSMDKDGPDDSGQNGEDAPVERKRKREGSVAESSHDAPPAEHASKKRKIMFKSNPIHWNYYLPAEYKTTVQPTKTALKPGPQRACYDHMQYQKRLPTARLTVDEFIHMAETRVWESALPFEVKKLYKAGDPTQPDTRSRMCVSNFTAEGAQLVIQYCQHFIVASRSRYSDRDVNHHEDTSLFDESKWNARATQLLHLVGGLDGCKKAKFHRNRGNRFTAMLKLLELRVDALRKLYPE